MVTLLWYCPLNHHFTECFANPQTQRCPPRSNASPHMFCLIESVELPLESCVLLRVKHVILDDSSGVKNELSTQYFRLHHRQCIYGYKAPRNYHWNNHNETDFRWWSGWQGVKHVHIGSRPFLSWLHHLYLRRLCFVFWRNFIFRLCDVVLVGLAWRCLRLPAWVDHWPHISFHTCCSQRCLRRSSRGSNPTSSTTVTTFPLSLQPSSIACQHGFIK